MLFFLFVLPVLVRDASAAGDQGTHRDNSTKAKLCDIFVRKGRKVCGPSIFIIGVGKCGTNALATYMQHHPLIKFTRQSEIRIINKTILLESILDHNPGVTPDDSFVWGIKHPGTWNQLDVALAKQMLKTFPSSRLFVTICDPSTLSFRWFRHHTRPELSNRNDNLHTRLINAGYHNFTLFYKRFWRIDNDCKVNSMFTDAKHQHVLAKVPSFSICKNWVNFFGLHRKFMDWSAAGYKLGQNIEVVVMEGWKQLGREYVTRFLSLLGLPVHTYNWAATNDFQPVYHVPDKVLEENHMESTDDIASKKEIVAAAAECFLLRAYLGREIPWSVCGAAAVRL